ncbi:uncharacterized protein [Zea mays]|uniref:RRM domain-containing protein n=2 Tax=Zea mays TaxID=4577 RepID=A0A804PND6_MAIZE|nr:uncharacterized protein LOC100279918 isoform X1 [Zea mays]
MATSSSFSGPGGSPAHASPGGGGGGGGGGGVGSYHHHRSRFGDTTLTKVFVGGLAWETPSEGLRQHFDVYGEILEAVVITDRETGRSKGYGFVIFRDPDAAARAVQNPNPVIAGRRANCNIAAFGPPRAAQPRGRGGGGGGRGPHVPDQPPQGSPSPYRVPSQMTPPHQAATLFYNPQFGYWYPPDYPYQQALYNSQVLQHYYPQMYGPASPSGPAYQYMGYMPGGPSPRTGFSPMQQPMRQPFFQQPTTQMDGSFPSVPSLPPNFRLQLPPRAVSRESDDASAGSQSAQPVSSTPATATNNEEDSRPVVSDSDPNTPN